MEEIKSGRDKIKEKQKQEQGVAVPLSLDDMMAQVGVTTEETSEPPVVLSTTEEFALSPEGAGEPVSEVEGVKGDPYKEMVETFITFLEQHHLIKPLRLTLTKSGKIGNYYIYQGQNHLRWVQLKSTGTCLFERKSLLRIILGLDDDHILKKYFGNYSIITGQETLSDGLG